MKLAYALSAVVVAAALVAGATAFAGPRDATVQRQRITINMIVNDKTDTATFTVNRLPGTQGHPPADTPGETLDKGAVAGLGGGAFGTTSRNGMMVLNVVRRPTLDGPHGTLELVQRYDKNEMPNGVHVGVGTWRIQKGSGTYAGIKGGGRYVAVSMPNGRTLVRQEGWVTGLD